MTELSGDRAARRHGRRPVLLGFVLGCGSSSAALALERGLHHAHVYGSPTALLFHLSTSTLVGIAVGVVLGLPSAALVAALQHRWHPARPWLALQVGAAWGFGIGVALYFAIVMPSKFGKVWDPKLGALVAGIGMAALAGSFVWLLRLGFRRSRVLTAASLLLLTTIMAWADAHAYLRSYGNVHVVAAAGTWLGWGAGCAGLLHRTQRTARLAVALCVVAVLCSVHVVFAEPSIDARRAILEYGAGEKLLIQHVLWPLLDRDRDGFAGGFLGPDCDDGNPAVAPPRHSRAFRCEQIEPARVSIPERETSSGGPGTRLSLVWVVIDTWRRDVPRVRPAVFDSFLELTGFRSCGSRTDAVVSQLLGVRGCARSSHRLAFPGELSDAGLAVRAFSQYDFVSQYFADWEHDVRAEAVLDRALRWIKAQSARDVPFFAYVHLMGGHMPYAGSGRTNRERYEDAIGTAVERVASFVSSLEADPVIVVMGDHGEEFGEHGGDTHATSLYEEVLATPVYMRVPGWPRRVEPTSIGCIELRNLIRQAIAGASYRLEPAKLMFATLDSPRGVHGGISHTVLHSLRFDATWKILWSRGKDIWELYDLSSDPGELENLADAEPARLQRGASLLLGALDACIPRGGSAR